MAHFEGFLSSFWGDVDDDIEGGLSLEAKAVYVYLLTCDRSHGITGMFRYSRRETLLHLSLQEDPARFDAALGELLANHKVLLEDGWLWVVNRAKYGVRSPNHARCALDHVEQAPAGMRDAFLLRYRGLLKKHGVDCPAIVPAPARVSARPLSRPPTKPPEASRRGLKGLEGA